MGWPVWAIWPCRICIWLRALSSSQRAKLAQISVKIGAACLSACCAKDGLGWQKRLEFWPMAANSKLAEDLPPPPAVRRRPQAGRAICSSGRNISDIQSGRHGSSQECQAGLAVVAPHAGHGLNPSLNKRPHHALGMRPPVPETLLEKREIYGTEIGG